GPRLRNGSRPDSSSAISSIFVPPRSIPILMSIFHVRVDEHFPFAPGRAVDALHAAGLRPGGGWRPLPTRAEVFAVELAAVHVVEHFLQRPRGFDRQEIETGVQFFVVVAGVFRAAPVPSAAKL